MSIRATYVGKGESIDITITARPDPRSAAILDKIHGACGPGVLECREHDDHPSFADRRDNHGRVHGAWCYLQKRFGKWVICQHPNSIGGGLESHEIPTPMTDQHRWQADYYSRAAQDAGHHVDREYGVGRVRLDVFMRGRVDVGIEVQHSALSIAKVRSRTRAAADVGITSIWSADREHPQFAFKVPHVETNQLPHGRVPRGRWTVTTGPRSLDIVNCSSRNIDVLPRCTKPRSRNWCGGDHAVWRPTPGLVVDDIAALAPAGELVALDTRTRQGVILVRPADRDLYLAEFAPATTATPSSGSRSRPCTYSPVIEPSLVEPPWHRPRPCPTCDRQSWAIRDRRCMRCRADAGLALL